MGNVRWNLSATSPKLRNVSRRMPRNHTQQILTVARCQGILLATALDVANMVHYYASGMMQVTASCSLTTMCTATWCQHIAFNNAQLSELLSDPS